MIRLFSVCSRKFGLSSHCHIPITFHFSSDNIVLFDLSRCIFPEILAIQNSWFVCGILVKNVV